MLDTDEQVTLFVDDVDTLLAIIKRRLMVGGRHSIHTVNTVEAAREMIKKGVVGHVIADWKLGIEDGIEFLKEIRITYPHVTCTLLTGFRRELGNEERRKLEAAGIAVYDKTQINTVWLEELIAGGGELSGVSARTDTPAPGRLGMAGSGDVIAELKLRNEELERRSEQERRLIAMFTQDLLEELKRVGDVASISVMGGRGSVKLDQIISDIANMTPAGLRWIELDRAARRRILGLNRS